MFLRCHERIKKGKEHRYWSVVEARRLDDGRTTQRQVLYLGEINDSQEAAWRKSIAVFDEDKQQASEACLFPDDRPIPADEVNALPLMMSEMQLLRPRSFGDCWLGCSLWWELRLDQFWQKQLGDDRGKIPWEKVLQLLAVNRLCEPGSEFAVHRHWFIHSAMDELLESDFAVADKDRLYRCLDRVLHHKDALCQHLAGQWKTLFDARFDVLLYDLTSTYFEGAAEQIPKAKHGYSRDQRGDCRQVVIALVVTTDGLPLAYEVLAGNTADKTTLAMFLEKMQSMYVQARSGQRQKKENAMRRRKLKKLVHGLNRLKRRKKIKRDCLLKRIAVLQKTAGRIRSFVKIREPKIGEPVNRKTFTAKLDKAAWKTALDRDGCYILRAHIPWEQWPQGMSDQPSVLWKWYMQLTHVEEAFKTLKSDLGLRPIHHQTGKRVEAHILVAFLGYCLTVTLRMKLAAAAPGLTPRAALQSLSAIQMLEVHVPTRDGRILIMPRHTEPQPQQQLILEQLKLSLPPQPPPRIRNGKLELPSVRSSAIL